MPVSKRNPPKVLPLFQKGDKLTAKMLNDIIGALNELTRGVKPPEQVKSFAQLSVRQFKFRSMGANTITCREWNGIAEGTVDILVAKPYLLRQSIASRDGVAYTYVSSVERTASKSGFPNETQVVSPKYFVGDIIYAATNVKGGLTIANTTVVWIDQNYDGRAWRKKA